MNVLRAIDQLESSVENGGGMLGKKLVNEQEMLAQFAVLRESIEIALRKKAEETPGFQPQPEIALILAQLQQAITPGKGKLFGKRVISELEFFTLVMKLRVALPKSMKTDAEPQGKAAGTPEKSPPTTPWG